MDYGRAFYYMKRTPMDYIIKFVVPLVLGSFAIDFLLIKFLPIVSIFILYTIPMVAVFISLIYPLIVLNRIKSNIDENFPFFIAYAGALATSEISGKELFKTISVKSEYGELAKECDNIFTLIDMWHMSLTDACRIVAKRTPSSIFADFLERFAQAVEAGQKVEVFLHSEQTVSMRNYEVQYQGSLAEIDTLKSILISLTTTFGFIFSIALIIPMISGFDITLSIKLAFFLMITAEILIIHLIKSKIPLDFIWPSFTIKTHVSEKLKTLSIFSVAGCFIVFIIVTLLGNILPLQLKAALVLTPLAIVGFYIHQHEMHVKRLEESYSEFIRVLGVSADGRAGALDDALKHVVLHDFGALTEYIHSLYTRLRLRIDKTLSWRFFAVECCSNLIQRFSDMFVESLNVGGKPLLVSTIISENFDRIQALRMQRYQNSKTLVGILYGLQAGISLTIFIAFTVAKMLTNISGSLSNSTDAVTFLYSVDNATLDAIYYILFFVIIIHALVSAFVIKIVDGGHKIGIAIHFVALVWIGALISIVAMSVLGSLIRI